MKETDIAWMAGLFEGEGTISIRGNKFRVAIEMTDLDVLQRVQSIFGGSLCQPTKREQHHKQSYKWSLGSNKTSYDFINLIKPFLFSRRKQKAEELVVKFESLERAKQVEKSLLGKRDNLIIEMKKEGFSDKAISEKLGIDRSTVTKAKLRIYGG